MTKLLAVSPFIFLAVLLFASKGRNLTAVFHGGSVAFLCIGAALVFHGLLKRQSSQARLGAGVLGSMLLVLGVSAVFGEVGWIGSETRLLTIVVKEAGTENPVPDAVVRVVNSFVEASSEKRTDSDGKAEFNFSFTAVGTSSLSRNTGGIYVWAVTLNVDAAGYQEISERLDKFMETPQLLYGPPLPVVQVSLQKSGIE